MTTKKFSCHSPNCPNKNKETENCAIPSIDDSLPIQCVNPWSKEKYRYFDSYLSATRKAREKYSKLNNSVYIDLFAGPGRGRIKTTQEEIDGASVRAYKLDIPFNEIVLNDVIPENCNTLETRMKGANIYTGDANVIIDKIVDSLLNAKYDKLHFAFLDPFAPSQLKFHTLARLSELKKVDIMINFPIYGIRINYDQWLAGDRTILNEFLGTKEWAEIIGSVTKDQFVNKILAIYTEQLMKLGFPSSGLGLIGNNGELFSGPTIVTIKNSQNSPLYYLLLISKHPLAAKIWGSIAKIDPKGQRTLYS